MKVRFIKNGCFGLDGYDVINCVIGDERECTDGHAAQLIKAGFAEYHKVKREIQVEMPVDITESHVEPPVDENVEPAKKRGRRKKNG